MIEKVSSAGTLARKDVPGPERRKILVENAVRAFSL